MDKKRTLIDRNLVASLSNGDEQAFEELFQYYKKDIFNYTNSLVKSRELAKDLTQEVFVKVWIKRKKLDAERCFRSLIFIMARNTTYDFLIKASKDRKLHQQVFRRRETTYSPIENQMLQAEYEILKKKALNSLPKKRRRIFEMSRIEGKSHKEISAELGISIQTVKNQVSQALGSISYFLKTYGDISLVWPYLIVFFSLLFD